MGYNVKVKTDAKIRKAKKSAVVANGAAAMAPE